MKLLFYHRKRPAYVYHSLYIKYHERLYVVISSPLIENTNVHITVYQDVLYSTNSDNAQAAILSLLLLKCVLIIIIMLSINTYSANLFAQMI